MVKLSVQNLLQNHLVHQPFVNITYCCFTTSERTWENKLFCDALDFIKRWLGNRTFFSNYIMMCWFPRAEALFCRPIQIFGYGCGFLWGSSLLLACCTLIFLIGYSNPAAEGQIDIQHASVIRQQQLRILRRTWLTPIPPKSASCYLNVG